ncbi:hypothetical protein HMPREF0106_02786 [Bacteroides sp. D22]|nr:hypothetical protein HMPREF0106_02786 [Bacteroides sp. D22]
MKKGNIMRDVISSSQFTANVIKEYKKGLGDVVLVAITPRTTIELPAHLTQAEIDARIEIYKKLHSSKGLSLKPWGIALKFLFLHHENILFPND